MKTTKTPLSANAGRRSPLRDCEDARSLAVSALTFLARDMERIERFLALTGVDPAELRGRLHETSFQLAILDHLAADEPLLMRFSQEEEIAPEMIGRARRALGGGDDG
jgi:hypothetical protein